MDAVGVAPLVQSRGDQLQRGDQRVWCRGEVGARALAGGGDEGGAQLAERDELQRGHQRLRERTRVGRGQLGGG